MKRKDYLQAIKEAKEIAKKAHESEVIYGADLNITYQEVLRHLLQTAEKVRP